MLCWTSVYNILSSSAVAGIDSDDTRAILNVEVENRGILLQLKYHRFMIKASYIHSQFNCYSSSSEI
jgi:hypothetical protein